jgi:hypothetical protein
VIPVLTLIKFAPWVLAGAGVAGTLWYRDQYHQCVAAHAVEANKAMAAVAAAKARDEVFTRGLEEQLRPVVDAIREQGNATQVALARVKSDPNCGRTPAASAFDRLVQPATGQAPAGPKVAPKP